jgi:hypothetical protein
MGHFDLFFKADLHGLTKISNSSSIRKRSPGTVSDRYPFHGMMRALPGQDASGRDGTPRRERG